MSEETVSREDRSVGPTHTLPPTVADHRVVKEAEVKFKEMSRKAKERQHEATRRKTQTNSRRPPQRQSGSNLRLALIAGFGIGVLGILYLMLRPQGRQR